MQNKWKARECRQVDTSIQNSTESSGVKDLKAHFQMMKEKNNFTARPKVPNSIHVSFAYQNSLAIMLLCKTL